jgi:hypothetical protein
MLQFGLRITIASLVIILGTGVISSEGQTRKEHGSQRLPNLASTRNAFEREGLLGGMELVLVRPMEESDTGVQVRASEAGVNPGSLRPKVYGLKFDILFKNAEIGSAFMRRAAVYHVDFLKDQIVVDETYYFCDGFLASDILKVKERSWSKYYGANAATITKLDTLAEAIRSGAGFRDALAILDPREPLGTGGEERNRSERDLTWLAGKEIIDNIGIELLKSPDIGNRVSVKFLE